MHLYEINYNYFGKKIDILVKVLKFKYIHSLKLIYFG